MKTILVPTDFSDNAMNAINYSAEIALFTKAKIILFHAFHIPTIPSDVPYVMPFDEIEKDALNALTKTKENIIHKYGKGLAIDCKATMGFAVDEINEMIHKLKIDLVIMGMNGGGYLSEKIVGSITTSLIRKAKCPVIAIGEHVKFKSIKKIVLACDYKKIDDISILEPLKEFIKLFKSHLYILNVNSEPGSMSSSEKSLGGAQLEHSFKELDHSFNFIENENIVDGINQFVDANNVDMIVMIPRKHTWIENLFQERNTKHMAFHSHIPLLALHEK